MKYFKNNGMRRKEKLNKGLDEEMGDVHSDIVGMEIEIVQALRSEILEYGAEFEDLSEFISILDAYSLLIKVFFP